MQIIEALEGHRMTDHHRHCLSTTSTANGTGPPRSPDSLLFVAANWVTRLTCTA